MRVPSEYMAAIKQLMGCITYQIEKGKRHQKLVFSAGGKQHKITMPGSPSDRGHGLENFKADLKRKLKGEAACTIA